jgi:hypothetical protein
MIVLIRAAGFLVGRFLLVGAILVIVPSHRYARADGRVDE